MIVVEGPDGAGKTTLIQGLAAYLNWPVAERVVSKQAEAMVDLVEWVEKNLAEGFQKKIFDRHRLISGPIYSTVLKGRPDEGYEDFQWLSMVQTKFLFEVQPIIIWCLPPLDIVKFNLEHDRDQPMSLLQSPRMINELYWLYYHRMSLELDPIVFDYTIDDVGTIYDRVDIALEERDDD